MLATSTATDDSPAWRPFARAEMRAVREGMFLQRSLSSTLCWRGWRVVGRVRARDRGVMMVRRRR